MNYVPSFLLHLYIRDDTIILSGEYSMADMKNKFWLGAGVGAIIIIIIDLMIPFLGPLIGGFVAGFIAKGDTMNAGKAGLVAGILATIVIAIIIVAGMISPPVAEYIPQMGTGYFLFITITLYLALFGLFGGLIAGALRR
jgi:uncharacterized protein YqgC (DUF456 family)